MTVNIKILPSGHVYTAEKGESVLEAGLRQGKALGYSCNTGSCGECKARLVSGELEKIRYFDYRFSREDKRDGMVLLCCMSAVSDVLLEARETENVQDIPHQEIQAKVARINKINDDWIVLEVKTPRTESLRFLAGQYVTLNLAGIPLRNKSIASCPCNGRQLHFHIRRSGEAFSEYVFNHLKPNTPISVEGPDGDFVMQDDSPLPMIFMAYDAGFAPMKSLIEHAFALDLQQPLHFYWLSSIPEPYLYNECRAWADAIDNFSFEVIHTPGKADILPTMERLVKGIENFQSHQIFLTLPHDLLDQAAQCCLHSGIHAARIKIDRMGRHS